MIYVNEQNKEFHLTNGQISYVFRVMEETNILEQLYYGSAIQHYESFDFMIEREIRPSNNWKWGSHLTSFEHIKQEFPVFGSSDFREPAIDIEYPVGDHISHFEFQHYTIRAGKTVDGDLPGSFGGEQEVETLAIVLKDLYSELYVTLHYHLYLNLPIVTRQQVIDNRGNETVVINRMHSLSLDIPNSGYDWIHLDGAWARETIMARDKIHSGIQNVSSTRGASSHVHNPFLAICEETTTNSQGNAYGFSLIYSGNFLAQIEKDTYNVLRIQLGINPHQFRWKLDAGTQFQTPEAIMVFSQAGLNSMSQSFHQFFSTHVIRSPWKKKEKPILINNWEATYFDFTEERLLEIAQASKRMGIEMFVLDDGWFGSRNNDNGSLGNWQPDYKKLPNGIQGISQKIHALGLKFGLWFEPEMVSKDTAIYLDHPEWVIGNAEKNRSHGRNQFVLDFGNPEVVEAIFEQVNRVLATAEIEYIKVDMNRYLSEVYSAILPADQQGEVAHRYILGVYRFFEKIIANYPDLLIESCAGGGARFDPGMLYYSPQIWTSDDTDAVERLKIQTGVSLLYPLTAISSHVSAVPNHQVGRVTSIEMRKNVALFGTFGYELNPLALSNEEQDQIAKQIAQYKRYQQLINQGTFYRLETESANFVSWLVTNEERTEALVGFYQILAEPNSPYRRIKLAGLDETKDYQVYENDQLKEAKRNGSDLQSYGIRLGGNFIGREQEYWSRELPGDFHSKLYFLKAIEMASK